MKIRFPVKTDLVVRFADVDVMGHVNNAVYLSYFEQARVAFFKKINKLDLRYMDAKSAFGFIVAEIGIKFLAPTYVDQTLTVGIRVAEIRLLSGQRGRKEDWQYAHGSLQRGRDWTDCRSIRLEPSGGLLE